MRIVFVGNFRVNFSTETHHVESLKALGHNVVKLQESDVASDRILNEAINSDLLVFVHTHGWKTSGNISLGEVFRILKEKNIPTVTYHLDLWFGLERQKDLLEDNFYQNIEWFFTVDKLMADWFNKETNVNGIYLPAAVFHREAIMQKSSSFKNDVLFVGSSLYHKEWPYRVKLINWLQDEYKHRFTHIGPGSKINQLRGNRLNKMYSMSKVSIGDTLCINFDYPYYWSDRVYETIGRGGFIIHPYIKGLDEHFENKKHLVFYQYGDFDDLKGKIDYYIERDSERERIRKQGFEHVKQNHTYLNRWKFILETVFEKDS